MAVNGIIITTNNTKGNDILSSINLAETLVATLPVIVDQMVQYIDSGDYTALENRYGIPAGQGENVYNLITGLKAAIADDSAVQQAVYRLG